MSSGIHQITDYWKRALGTALAAIALLMAGALALPPCAEAAELAPNAVEAQSAYTNTSLANAQELPFGESYTGTFDYATGTTTYEDYWFRFKTSNRNSEYVIQLDSKDSKEIAFEIHDDNGSIVEWSRRGGGAYNGGSYYYTKDRVSAYSSDASKNSWYYVVVHHRNASRYNQYALTVYEKKILSAENLSLSPSSFTFDGTAKQPAVTVAYGGQTLVKDVDYYVELFNNTNAGAGTVKVTGMGDDYTGEVSKTFAINQRPASLRVALSPASFTYNGSELRPTVTVYDGSAKLEKGVDYEVTEPKQSTDPGTYAVTVKCEGNYSGTASAAYAINKAPSSISLVPRALTYSGSPLRYDGSAVTKGSNGAVSYSYYSDSSCTRSATPKNAGTYYVRGTLAANAYYAAATSAPVRLTVGKATNTLKATAKSPSVKYSVVKKKSRTLSAAQAVSVKGAKGAVTYKKKSGNGKVSVASNGKVTVKKGLKKGVYPVKIAVKAAGNANYKTATKTVTVRIRVK